MHTTPPYRGPALNPSHTPYPDSLGVEVDLHVGAGEAVGTAGPVTPPATLLVTGVTLLRVVVGELEALALGDTDAVVTELDTLIAVMDTRTVASPAQVMARFTDLQIGQD